MEKIIRKLKDIRIKLVNLEVHLSFIEHENNLELKSKKIHEYRHTINCIQENIRDIISGCTIFVNHYHDENLNCVPFKTTCLDNCLCESCFQQHLQNGCSYGQPDGPDDYYKDCECEKV